MVSVFKYTNSIHITYGSILGHQTSISVLIYVHTVVGVGGNKWGNHVVRGRGDIHALLAREDVKASDVSLGVSVLASLGSGDLDDLAWESLKHDYHALLYLSSSDRVGLQCLRVSLSCLGVKRMKERRVHG